MASNPPAKCCSQGFRHTGTTRGATEVINGINAYVTGDKSSSKVLLFFSDVIGYEYTNSQLLADNYADEGYLVVVPDIYDGDFVPLNTEGFDAPTWIARHSLEFTEPIVQQAYAGVVEKYKPQVIVSAGYCVGARYTIRLLGQSKISAGVAFHPSFVTIDEVAAIKKPLFIAAAENDDIFTERHRQETEEKLKEINATFYITLLSKVGHGFAVRGNPSDVWERTAKEKAFADSIWWYKLFE